MCTAESQKKRFLRRILAIGIHMFSKFTIKLVGLRQDRKPGLRGVIPGKNTTHLYL